MKSKLTLLNSATLVVMAGPLLAASDMGTIRPFTLDAAPNYFFAMLPGDGDVPVLICLTAVDDGYKAMGLGDAFGQDIMFVDAELRADGTMAEIEHADFVLNGKSDLSVPLVETLALIASAGLGGVRRADLIFGDQTMFELTDKGSTNVTTLRLGKTTYGVYHNPDKIQVVALDVIDGTRMRVTATLGAVPTSDAKLGQAGTAATAVGTDQSLHGKREAVAA